MITLNVRAMPDDLYKRMRVRVAEEGLTVRAFVFQAIEDKLNAGTEKPEAPRTEDAPAWEKPKLGYKEAKARKAASRFEKETPAVQEPQ